MAAADWSELPWDLLNLVVTRLGIPHDLERFKSVCSSWRSSSAAAHVEQLQLLIRPSRPTPHPPQFLGLMLPGDETGRRDFYGPLDDKVYKNLLRVPDDHLCRGNRDGWLITISATAFSPTKNICLLNPLSGDVQMYRFPSLTSLKDRDDEWNPLEIPSQIFWFVARAVLSANIIPAILSDDQTSAAGGPLTMVVVYGQYCRLAYAREGAEAWVVVEEVVRAPYTDIVYYRDGFYAVNDYGTVFFVDVDCSVPTVRVVVPEEEDPLHIAYLVESQDGKLLLISRDVESSYDAHEEGKALFETILFQVFQLDLKNHRRNQIWDLGDQSLFLGVNTSLSIPSPEKIGLKKNCIYFTDESTDGNPVLGGSDIGLFDLGTKKN